jgi:hypothetical protein
MQFDVALDDGEAEPGADRLGGEVGLEAAAQRRTLHADTRVTHAELDAPAVV